MPFITIILIFLLEPSFIYGQQDILHIKKGNEFYKKEKYKEAELEYRKAIKANDSWVSKFNLANALYNQKKYDEASAILNEIKTNNFNKDILSKVYHNQGNIYLQQNELKKSIEAYKNALRAKPDDEETRYNLAYAMKKLEQVQKNSKQNEKSNENKSENQKEPKPEDQNQHSKDGINKKEADQILDALNRNEKDLRKNLNEKKENKKNSSNSKDW